MILDPQTNLTLRPMRYPQFYEMYKDGIRNTWTVEEVEFSNDLKDLTTKLSLAELHMVKRLVAFFATGDAIVSDNLVTNLYAHINSPEARMYLSRQLFEEAVHIQFYLTLLDTYIPDHEERHEMFRAIDTIPSIADKAAFAYNWLNNIHSKNSGTSSFVYADEDRQRDFLQTLICFAACIEGLFFYGAFAYVYFMRSKGLLNGLASGTNWVFRDESAHMNFAFAVIDVIKEEYPNLWTANFKNNIQLMMQDAVACEVQFGKDLLGGGVMGLTVEDMRQYLEYIADQRLTRLGIDKIYNTRNPLTFMDLQDVQELSNFFERRVSSYQTGVGGEVVFNESF